MSFMRSTSRVASFDVLGFVVRHDDRYSTEGVRSPFWLCMLIPISDKET